jgi:HPt (histidine-containing phosphotransfer) domain-containing protein
VSSAPDTDPATRARAVLADIGSQALQTNRQRLERLEHTVALAARGALTEDERRQAAEIAHQLVGSAGTFGYARVSRLARGLEQQLRHGPLTDPAALASALADLPVMAADLQGRPDDDLA